MYRVSTYVTCVTPNGPLVVPAKHRGKDWRLPVHDATDQHFDVGGASKKRRLDAFLDDKDSGRPQLIGGVFQTTT